MLVVVIQDTTFVIPMLRDVTRHVPPGVSVDKHLVTPLELRLVGMLRRQHGRGAQQYGQRERDWSEPPHSGHRTFNPVDTTTEEYLTFPSGSVFERSKVAGQVRLRGAKDRDGCASIDGR